MDLTLQVGVAETTINPLLGMQIDGDIGVYRPAQVILNDLYARAIVFQKGDVRSSPAWLSAGAGLHGS